VRFRVVGRSPGFSTVAGAPSRGPPEPDPPARHSTTSTRPGSKRDDGHGRRVRECHRVGVPLNVVADVLRRPRAVGVPKHCNVLWPQPTRNRLLVDVEWSVAALVPSASSVESNSMCPNATPWGRDRDRSARPSAARSSFRTPLGHRPDPPRPRSPTRRIRVRRASEVHCDIVALAGCAVDLDGDRLVRLRPNHGRLLVARRGRA